MSSGIEKLAGDDADRAAQRAEYRAAWEARIVPVLTNAWQSSAAIAAALAAAPNPVHERLTDLAKRGAIERRIVRVADTRPVRKNRRHRHMRRPQAEFRTLAEA
jgi:predicted ArsR family transcriptional regulator